MGLTERIQATLEDPLALTGLVINLIPIFAVLFLGWGAAPIIFLYWLENIVLGVITLFRMTAATMKEHPIGLAGMVFYGPFFTVHYGMFCFVHGVFLASFATMGTPDETTEFFSPITIFQTALSSGQNMVTFLAVIAAWHVAVFILDDIMRGQFRRTSLEKEMMAPYGNLIVLHIALLLGGGLTMALGDPLLGVLALVLLRAAWGIFMDMRRVFREEPKDIKS
ncbi:MAG: DUF6498-containing protein [Pseudomonadota bacterium]